MEGRRVCCGVEGRRGVKRVRLLGWMGKLTRESGMRKWRLLDAQ